MDILKLLGTPDLFRTVTAAAEEAREIAASALVVQQTVADHLLAIRKMLQCLTSHMENDNE